MTNVVTYCRVSSEEQAQKDISIPAQRKLLLRWVEERPDHQVLAEFVDEGQSAYAPADKRPGFCEMVSFCRKHRVDAILVHKLDRFSRNREESILFKSLLRKHGVAIRSITENFDPETPQGFLYEGMIEVINQFYSMNLATETLKGMRENAERGHVNGGRIPYGYKAVKVADAHGREHGVLAFSTDEEVAVVREIFEMATTRGMGCKSIANALNEGGVKAPRGKHWNGATIDHILNNRVYVGDSVWFKSRKQGRTGRQRTAEDERIVVEDAHPAIIARETFERRKALAAERRFDVHTSPHHRVNYLLSRLIVCDVCGSHFCGRRLLDKKTEKFAYYCGGYMNKGSSVCVSLPIPKHWLENTVVKLLRARLCEPAALAQLEAKIRDRVAALRREFGSDSRSLEQKLADIERRIENYYTAIGDGLDPAVCRAKIAELTTKKEELGREVALLKKDDFLRKALERNIAELHRFSTIFAEQFHTLDFPHRRQVVLHFISKIEVVERSQIKIHFRVPFDSTGLKHLVDDLAVAGTDAAPESEAVTLPTILDSRPCPEDGIRGFVGHPSSKPSV